MPGPVRSLPAFVLSQRSQGWILLEHFDDDGYSGATSDRPALQRLLGLVRNRRLDRVVVYHLERLSRSLLGCASLLKEFRNHGVGLVVVTAPELGDTAQDSFMLNILASFAEFEREMIASRIAEGRVRLKARGRRIGGAVRQADEAAIVKWMFHEAASGRKAAEVVYLANVRGWRTKERVAHRSDNRRPGNRWTARQVIATLRNPVYVGLFLDKGDSRAGHHEAILTRDLFAAAAAQLDARRTRVPGRRYSIDWPLKGRSTCATCNRIMSPQTIRYRNILYRYYRCRSTAGGRVPCGYQDPHKTSKMRCYKTSRGNWESDRWSSTFGT